MDYPSNSSRRREAREPEPKKIERVVTSEVIRQKPSIGKRITEIFVGGDAKSVWAYVAYDVLVPAAKDMISDAVSSGVERMLFGDSSRPGRRGRTGTNGFVSYNKFASKNNPREERREISRRSRASHNFDEIILATRAEADEVIDRLYDLVSRYDSATVADLYELVGVTGDYTDEKYGWTDLRGASAARVRNGYLLDLPKPELLD